MDEWIDRFDGRDARRQLQIYPPPDPPSHPTHPYTQRGSPDGVGHARERLVVAVRAPHAAAGQDVEALQLAGRVGDDDDAWGGVKGGGCGWGGELDAWQRCRLTRRLSNSSPLPQTRPPPLRAAAPRNHLVPPTDVVGEDVDAVVARDGDGDLELAGEELRPVDGLGAVLVVGAKAVEGAVGGDLGVLWIG
jgi:hypothetical protein